MWMLSPFSWADVKTDTRLVVLQVGTPEAFRAVNLGNRSIYTSNGDTLSLKNRYTPSWFDSRIELLTSFSKHDALIWGFSTGQRSPNLTIEPSIKLGWIHNFEFSKQSSFVIAFTKTWGGNTKEKPCYADYGFGKEEAVNCRMADLPISPKASLAYLNHDRPYNHYTLKMKYSYVFH